MIAIQAGKVLTPQREIRPGTVLIKESKIIAVGRSFELSIPSTAEIIEVPDKIVVPGFIDTHTHGRDGEYFGESARGTAALCRSVASTGVTSLLPTLASLLPLHYSLELILEKIRKVREAMRMETGAEILGIHMEGPFLSAEETARGSQIASNMRHPSVTELERMNQASDGSIRKMTISPELPGSLDVIRRMDQLGIVPCAGHSTASLEQVAEAVDAGLKCATHVFNAMVPLHHRRPGLLGATLTNPALSAELIADGQHVSPVAMDILLRCKGVNGVHLVTDNTIWAGLPNGIYADGTREIVKEDQKACVRGGTLIGSVVGINQCVANLVQMVGCSMQDAVQMATLNPARVIGCNDRKGSLQPGSDADLLIVDEAIEVQLTMAKGKILYQARDETGY